ncbi:DUF5793 family protein [Halopenitus persicus]|uniref:Uncharacterized protein n=1 Tax=Halopenitus persicus TaxID=1048396 RepID=A0A1H3HIU8_9EURY|nr:DUF5793 family protein [Halopenitus persicus]QHS15977.1 hypothetical protein GWK26_01755 [haloarchaeon 3A1-DGR]SDY14728.1 hypothetical protein SAMN05216564_103275 [Halopenitus persicus]
MRREYFELTVDNVDPDAEGGHRKPLVRIAFHGPDGLLTNRLTGPDGELLAADETDVAFRLRDSLEDAPDAEGVVAVTNRVTGDFVLELNEEADDVRRFIRAAREYGRSAADDEEGRYRVEITVDGEELVTYDKRTFLVYDPDGNLLRGESLIPSGVEL